MPTMQDADTEVTHETTEQQWRTQTTRASRAPWLATLASAAACALPLLLTGGLAAGVGALYNVWIVVPVIVAAGVAGASLLWRRRRQAAVRKPIAGESWPALLAVPRDENDTTPIACTLEPDSAPVRLADWQQLIAKATSRSATSDGVSLTFDHDTALTGEITRLAAAEVACCSFFTFNIAIDANGVRLDAGAPPDARRIIESVFLAADNHEVVRPLATDTSRRPSSRKDRTALAAVLAVLASVTACMLPLLLAGGVAAGLGAAFNEWDIWATVALAVTGIGVLIWWRRRNAVGAAAARGDAANSCGPSC